MSRPLNFKHVYPKSIHPIYTNFSKHQNKYAIYALTTYHSNREYLMYFLLLCLRKAFISFGRECTCHDMAFHHFTLPQIITPYHLTLPYLTSHHTASPNLASYHTVLPFFTSHHVTSPYLTISHHIASARLTSYHTTPLHSTLYHLTSLYFTSQHIRPHYFILPNITPYHFTSPYIISYHITRHHLTLRHIISYHILYHISYHIFLTGWWPLWKRHIISSWRDGDPFENSLNWKSGAALKYSNSNAKADDGSSIHVSRVPIPIFTVLCCLYWEQRSHRCVDWSRSFQENIPL